jgi:hypothetical protein
MRYRFLFIAVLFSATFCCARTLSDTSLIKEHLKNITKTNSYRTCNNTEQLDKTAAYIKSVFEKYSDHVTFQVYTAEGRTYRNVICSFGTENKKRIIIGAHYDVCGNQEGADDNASGVTGLLELARLLKGQKLKYSVDLVAFSLEEPPFFETEFMGSYIHAKSLRDSNVKVTGMISLEMIGYFSDAKGSQTFPAGFLSVFYGNKGNFIVSAMKWGSGKFVRKFVRKFKSHCAIKAKKFNAPGSFEGIDYSDHANYWKFGYSAFMITDSAFFRNKNYHRPGDTMETLDIIRMSKVIDGIFKALLSICN